MRINKHQIFTIIGVSFFTWMTALHSSRAETWYDAEGRELRFDGKSLIRKEVEPKKEIVLQEAAAPIVPNRLELRPDLSTEPSGRAYNCYRPYFLNTHYRSGYDHHYYGGYGNPCHQYFRPNVNYFGNACVQPCGGLRHSYYLNYQRGNWLIQSRL